MKMHQNSRMVAHLPLTPAIWLTANEAAAYLRVEARTLLLWARQGKVKGHVLSGTRRQTWRFLRSDLDATLAVPSVAEPGRIQ
jgi:excisionase family DNA binding protein